MSSGYVTYYWQASTVEALEAILMIDSIDEEGHSIRVSVIDNLGVCEGNGVFGEVGVFYTSARSEMIMQTPEGCELADPYVVSNLLGVWA